MYSLHMTTCSKNWKLTSCVVCIDYRELLGQNAENIRRLLQQTIANELSPTRSPNNMMLITVVFQQSPDRPLRFTSLCCIRPLSFLNFLVLLSSAQKRCCLQLSWHEKTKVKGECLDTCYIATYMSQTRDQQRFTVSEVAADWHEPMVPQCIMWPSIARANRQLDPWCR